VKRVILQSLALCLVFQSSTPALAEEGGGMNQGDVTRKLHGTTKAKAIIDMRLPVSGAVTSTQRKMGERVHAGDILLQIDNRDAQENSLLRKAELQRSEAEASLSRKQWQRKRANHEKGLIADLDLETSYLEYQQDLAELKIAEARLQMALIHLNNYRLVALTDGVILSDGPAQGQFLSTGEPALSVLDDSSLSVVVQLSQAEIALLHENALSLRQQDPGGPEFGITRVAPRTLKHSTLIEVEVAPLHGLLGTPTVGTLIPLQLSRTGLQELQNEISIGGLANREEAAHSDH